MGGMGYRLAYSSENLGYRDEARGLINLNLKQQPGGCP